MATLYGSTGEETDEGNPVSLPDIEARLLQGRYDTKSITHTPGDHAPRLDPVHKWPTYVLLQVFDSEPKTTLFPKSGFYHLRELSVETAKFLI